jgi:hypothetical protein
MAIIDRGLRPHDYCKFEGAWLRATGLGMRSSKLLSLFVISFAVTVAGCARNLGPRDFNPAVHEVKAAPMRFRHSRHDRHTQPGIRRPDQALLTPQPAPDCEYRKSELKTVDPNEWARLETEYELQCYRDAEKAARTRLSLLQASMQHARD